MLATSTHDTKRSEDVRARLAVLSEIPDAWTDAVTRWSQGNNRYRTDGMPDRNTEYLLYQTLVGITHLPSRVDESLGGRVAEYMLKASREAKQHTSWIEPNHAYDDALRRFVEGALADMDFVADVEDFVRPLVDPGYVNSLAQTLLKLTSPGVPDIYQGQELWDFSLVDPDNRRPVDYEMRRRVLSSARTVDGPTAWAERASGTPKLMVTTRALRLRAERPDAFSGDYEPLFAMGEGADHIVAFSRAGEVVTIVPRLPLAAASHRWFGTTLSLPGGSWRNVFTDTMHEGTIDVAPLIDAFPVALLVRGDA